MHVTYTTLFRDRDNCTYYRLRPQIYDIRGSMPLHCKKPQNSPQACFLPGSSTCMHIHIDTVVTDTKIHFEIPHS